MDEGNALVKLFIQVPEKMREEEFDSLRSQIVTSNGRGGRRYLPYNFITYIKDAGRKCFGITLMEDNGVVTELLNRLHNI
jgi:hypothetical protein